MFRSEGKKTENQIEIIHLPNAGAPSFRLPMGGGGGPGGPGGGGGIAIFELQMNMTNIYGVDYFVSVTFFLTYRDKNLKSLELYCIKL